MVAEATYLIAVRSELAQGPLTIVRALIEFVRHEPLTFLGRQYFLLILPILQLLGPL